MLCTGIKGQFDDDIAPIFLTEGAHKVLLIFPEGVSLKEILRTEAPEVKSRSIESEAALFIPEHIPFYSRFSIFAEQFSKTRRDNVNP